MSTVTITLNKKVILISILIVAIITTIILYPRASATPLQETYNALPTLQAKKLFFEQSESLTKEVPERLVELDQLTIGCFGTSKIMSMQPTDAHLGGQCCGILKDLDSYDLQLKAIQAYITKHQAHIGEDAQLIPPDPYDVPVEHAQRLITLDQLSLTPEQQNTYDQAVQQSHHGGPCCCKCWKWYMMSGLAKKLIIDHDFTEEDIAELWDTSSSCGHDDDTNMFKHYQTKNAQDHDR